jgi:hypothetical protein
MQIKKLKAVLRLARLKVRRFGPIVAASSFAVVASPFVAINTSRAYQYWVDRAPLRAMARQVESLALTYEQAAANGAQSAGKPVRWLVIHSGELWYCDGMPSKPVVWTAAPPPDDGSGMSWRSHGRWVLASVQGAGPKGVELAFHGFD